MNKLCENCRKNCKQTDTAMVVECRKYCPVPIQMTLKFKNKKSRLKNEAK